jgi:ERCC4-type nuclease
MIDSREPAELLDFVKKKYGKETEIETGQYDEGDYISERVICERKTIGDLNASLQDGRFVSQLNRIATHADKIPILLVVGDIHDYCKKMRFGKSRGRRVQCNEKMLYGAIAMAAYRYNFEIIWAPTDRDGLTTVISYMQAIEEGKYMMPTKASNAALLSRLFGIPLKSMKAILAEYNTIEKIGLANPKDLCKFPGIGDVKAVNIIRTFRRDMNDA